MNHTSIMTDMRKGPFARCHDRGTTASVAEHTSEFYSTQLFCLDDDPSNMRSHQNADPVQEY